MHKTARFNTEQLHYYTTGYYWGVIMALRVADAAIERFALFEKVRRAVKRAKRSA
jgi:hypothetical protein